MREEAVKGEREERKEEMNGDPERFEVRRRGRESSDVGRVHERTIKQLDRSLSDDHRRSSARFSRSQSDTVPPPSSGHLLSNRPPLSPQSLPSRNQHYNSSPRPRTGLGGGGGGGGRASVGVGVLKLSQGVAARETNFSDDVVYDHSPTSPPPLSSGSTSSLSPRSLSPRDGSEGSPQQPRRRGSQVTTRSRQKLIGTRSSSNSVSEGTRKPKIRPLREQAVLGGGTGGGFSAATANVKIGMAEREDDDGSEESSEERKAREEMKRARMTSPIIGERNTVT